MKENTKASLVYLLPATASLVGWYLILFYKNPPQIDAREMFTSLMMDVNHAWVFRWWLAIPVVCVALAGAYATRFAATRHGSITLLLVGVAFAVASWLTMYYMLSILVSMPIYFGARTAWPFLTTGKRTE